MLFEVQKSTIFSLILSSIARSPFLMRKCTSKNWNSMSSEMKNEKISCKIIWNYAMKTEWKGMGEERRRLSTDDSSTIQIPSFCYLAILFSLSHIDILSSTHQMWIKCHRSICSHFIQFIKKIEKKNNLSFFHFPRRKMK